LNRQKHFFGVLWSNPIRKAFQQERSMKRIIISMLCAAGLLACTGNAFAAVQKWSANIHETRLKASDEAIILAANESASFTEVGQIFSQRCTMCHVGAKPAAGLRLDSHSNAMAGSKNGPVIIPKEPENSEVIKRVRGLKQPRMPMNGPPWLSDNEITLIEQWISAGAPGEPTADADETQTSDQISAEATSDPKMITYTDVAPVFNTRCIKCHAEKGMMGPPPEGLRLDSYEYIIASRERAWVVPGSPDASQVVRAVRGQSRPRMPFDGPPYLSDEEIGLITAWIAEGARDPEGKAAPVPVGARVRLGGKLTERWALDGLPLVVDKQTRIDKNPSVGNHVEVRGTVRDDGKIRATRIRSR
jgi:uncharacterized membrane protein